MSALNIKSKASFECSDGRLFTDREEALEHEFHIKIRSFFEGDKAPASVSCNECIASVVSKTEELNDIIGSYRRSLSNIKRSKSKSK